MGPMATLVSFHAHPDDEVIATGGLLARASAEGNRVVLVVATAGEYGEVPDDLGPGETLADRRRAETAAAAEVLGVDRIVWLGYTDSGMTGWAQNDEPTSFWQADVDEAAQRLATVLRDERADVLTIYDWHGNYGHPDHIQVHRVGVAAGALVPQVRVIEATMNRDAFVRIADRVRGAGGGGEPGDDFDPHAPADDGNPMGMPESELTLAVDVSGYLGAKRAALACHRSQVQDSSFFLAMPEEAFAAAFGTEWFIEHGVDPPFRDGWIFPAAPG